MQVKFKWGLFSSPVCVNAGDQLTCNLEEYDPATMCRKTQSVTEQIKTAMIVSHWLMFYIPEIGTIGGMFGGPELIDRIGEVFCNPVEVDRNSFLTA